MNDINNTELTPELFKLRVAGLLETIALFTDMHERAETFSGIMNTARDFGIEQEVYNAAQEIAKNFNVPEFWEFPKPFKKEHDLVGFPVDCLPEVLSTYLKELSDNIQVVPDMAALPMLSVLSLCVQGKAAVRNPGGGNIETLNLYTLTVAEPGERKSGVFRALTAPLYSYQKEENERRKPFIEEYKRKKAMLEKQLGRVSKGKGYDQEKAAKLTDELNELKPVYPLTLNVTDTTPEALAGTMVKNNERIGILNDEGGIFDILSGMYSSGAANIDLFLKAYDGSPYNIIRCTREPIDLEHPQITFGLMAQSEPFEKAMNNTLFSGRGLVHRFMYSFPTSLTGKRTFTSCPVSEKAEQGYKKLIYKLLDINKSGEFIVMKCNKNAFNIFSDYHYSIEEKLKEGGMLEYMKEWGNKQVGRALKIAGILHLCCHAPEEPIDEKIALSAVSIALWCENQAMKAFGEIETGEEYKEAKYVLGKIQKKGLFELSRMEINQLCRGKYKSDELDEPLDTLISLGYIREVDQEYSGNGRKPLSKYKINPIILSRNKK